MMLFNTGNYQRTKNHQASPFSASWSILASSWWRELILMLISRDSVFTIVLEHTQPITKPRTYLPPLALSKISSTSGIRATSILLAELRMERFGTPSKPLVEQRSRRSSSSWGREKNSVWWLSTWTCTTRTLKEYYNKQKHYAPT